jgi:hypothetical protein
MPSLLARVMNIAKLGGSPVESNTKRNLSDHFHASILGLGRISKRCRANLPHGFEV